MKKIGYAFLKEHLNLVAFEPEVPAEASAAVNSIVHKENKLLVPKGVAPDSQVPLDHVLFALKHEGINLQILAEALPQIDVQSIYQRVLETPGGEYVRKAAYLWEKFNKKELEGISSNANYVDLFDDKRYVTGARTRDSKWRVVFNGIGSIDYCPTVERTGAINAAIENNVLNQTKQFIDEIGAVNADRALAWAYLSETESSYAIEGESASSGKAERFMTLLKHAHARQNLTEEYLCNLQNQAVSNVYDQAASFRNEQNWLSRGGRGALAVTYVPPSPELLHKLMPAFMEMANNAPTHTDPIVAASVTSFGFVYLHPFMDGNGRLSRFLFHQELCKSGQLEKGLLLPVSVAMKSNEEGYLHALQSFSSPARELWQVEWIDGQEYDFKFKGTESIYRYWNATENAEFGFAMASRALNTHLRDEVAYLKRFDRVEKAINEKFDIRQNILHTLINGSLDFNGNVSKNMRKRFIYQVPPDAFDYIENVAKEALLQPMMKSSDCTQKFNESNSSKPAEAEKKIVQDQTEMNSNVSPKKQRRKMR